MGGGTWVASDPHFSHANILKFERSPGVPLRDFKDVTEMNETMIDNWNRTVKDGDRVYLLGDVAFHPKVFEQIIPRLKGRIVLVPGNHEPPKMRKYFHLFDDVRGYVVKKGVIMSHIPIHPGSLSRWKINIHGHLHANNVLTEAPFRDSCGNIMSGFEPIEVPDPRYVNVSMEQIDFTPKSLSKIIEENGGPW
jgi:calcineurin-like phosphoesterase family protein